jgi:hypothetical protein
VSLPVFFQLLNFFRRDSLREVSLCVVASLFRLDSILAALFEFLSAATGTGFILSDF